MAKDHQGTSSHQVDGSISRLPALDHWIQDDSIGIRNCANVNIPAPPAQLTVNQLHSDEHGSVEAELVTHSSHTHTLYHDDNS